MTDLLTELMHDKADSLGAPDLDLHVLMRNGERRVTRRRTAILGGLAAAAVVAALVVPGLVGSGNDSLVATAPDGSLTYAVGSTIHSADGTVDVGRRILQLVETPSGFVVADDQWKVLSVTGDDVIEVGQMDPERFSGFSSDGDVVAWVENSISSGAKYAVLDQAAGAEVLRARFGNPPDLPDDCDEVCSPLRIVSVDDRTLYLDDARGLLVWRPFEDVAPELIPTVGDQPPVVLDVAGGLIARRFAGQVRLARDLGEGLIIDTMIADLSPGGRYLLTEAAATFDTGMQPRVYDAGTGEKLTVDIGSANQAHGYRWLDEDTFGVSVYGADGSGQQLLACEVPSGECSTVLSEDSDLPLLLPSR